MGTRLSSGDHDSARCTAAGCVATPTPTTRITYELTASPSTSPVSRVVTTTELDCDGVLGEADGSLTSIGYIDGLGRVRATLAPGGSDAPWVRSGLTTLNAKGATVDAWQTDFFSGSDGSYAAVLALPSQSFPHTRSLYDAFGRVYVAYAEDGAITTTSYHTLSTDVCDPLDNDGTSPHVGTCTTARTDGHGRLIDQVLRNHHAGVSGTEYHRLWTWYRNDGAVTDLSRLLTASDATLRSSTPAGASTYAVTLGSQHQIVHRAFIYDSVGRRIGSDDPDTDDLSNSTVTSRTWRYLFNRVGDLAAVRDPRGCGQNFFYDRGGRLVGEQYVACSESQSSRRELPIETVSDTIGMSAIAGSRAVDVHYYYDQYPTWITLPAEHETLDVALPTSHLLGRATGVSDRGQRAAVAYDDRGNAVWTARQVAVISAPLSSSGGTLSTALPNFGEQAPSANGTVAWDTTHTYIRRALFDHAGRPTAMALPRDPNWDPTTGIASAPLVSGTLTYNTRGLPSSASLVIGPSAAIPIVRAIHYLRDGMVDSIEYGTLGVDHHAVVTSGTEYDDRRRPIHMTAVRTPTAATGLAAVTAIADQHLVWDAASNLTGILDNRDPAEWPERFRPQSVTIDHDSLYRVVGALFDYSLPGDLPGSTTVGADTASDWRSEAAASNAVDPMRPQPAPMATALPPTRVQWLGWDWDWLGNMTEWTDDQQQFYERSIGDITNGFDIQSRPSAIYLAANIDSGHPERSGWAEVGYGVSGNVTGLTVYGSCGNAAGQTCTDPGPASHATRATTLHATCSCGLTQRYEYRWDELNRISEARRFDRAGTSNWTFEARQRYRYDGANVRVVKESIDTGAGTLSDLNATSSRVALYIYPGDFERRGLERTSTNYVSASTAPGTETQYVVAGARVVWDETAPPTAGTELDRPHRITIPVSDLLHTTAASVDLWSGELLEVSTYYPNGARETLRANDVGDPIPLEPMGFTGKEADEDVGLVYFGERYLVARIGRWASPDPIYISNSGGGEALNAYHYVSGGLLVANDPQGLDVSWEIHEDASGTHVVGRMDVVVYAELQGQQDEAVSRYTEGAAVWNRATATRLPDGRRADVRIEITVRGATADERAALAALGDYPMRRDGPTPERSAVTRAYSDYARQHDVNVVIAGREDSGEYVHGPVVSYSQADAAADGAGYNHIAAHSLGHLMGLEDRYQRPGDAPREGHEAHELDIESGSVMPDGRRLPVLSMSDRGYEWNIMGAGASDFGEMPGYQPWLGWGQAGWLAAQAVRTQAYGETNAYEHVPGRTTYGDVQHTQSDSAPQPAPSCGSAGAGLKE